MAPESNYLFSRYFPKIPPARGANPSNPPSEDMDAAADPFSQPLVSPASALSNRQARHTASGSKGASQMEQDAGLVDGSSVIITSFTQTPGKDQDEKWALGIFRLYGRASWITGFRRIGGVLTTGGGRRSVIGCSREGYGRVHGRSSSLEQKGDAGSPSKL